MKYKAAIFDMDGTILDTLQDLTNSVNFALAENGLPTRTTDEVRSFVGNGIRKLVERAAPATCPKEAQEQVFESFNAHYARHCADNTKAYDGISDVVRKLKEHGVKCAVVSNKSDYAVQPLCKQYFPRLFDTAVGVKEGIRPKPNPDAVLSVLEQFSVSKRQAVYIGDSQVDVQTAKNASVDCIAVLWGFRDRQTLEDAGAIRFAQKAQDLLPYFA